jgi:predicted TIM-barrel fold metal-dependent hydrolase
VVQTIERQDESKLSPSKPLIVLSADAHMGPKFGDMRQYCPQAMLDSFDEEAKGQIALLEAMRSGKGFGFTAMNPGAPEAQRLVAAMERNAKTAGHHDVHAYLRDMDADGVAVEMFFHGSQNGEGVPFLGFLALSPDHTDKQNFEKRAVGMHMYNQWLADAVAVAPNRLMPAMLLPMWDIDASVKELEWGLAHGLRVVNFQAPRAGVARYDTPAWEPFWSLAEEGGAILATHSGATDAADFAGATGPHFFTLIELEAGGWMARRAIAWLIFGGVFARHPGLRYCITEQNGEWWSATVREYDSSYVNHRFMYADQVPDLPSHYLKQNVFIGASFMAPFEAKWAVEQDYWENVLWGRDYPHIEGTFAYQDEADALSEANCTHLSMRNCFSGIDPEPVAAMLGGNAVRAFGLDEAELQKVADRIHAPTLEELEKPVEGVPDGGILAYRTMGPWW